MKWFFTFLIFLAVASFSTDLVCKLIDVSKTSKVISLPGEDTDEPSEEEDPEEKVKLREYDWFCANVIEKSIISSFSNKPLFLIPSDQMIEQPSFSVPFSPPEMS